MFSPTCWIKGQEKAKPHRGPAVGEHSAEVLREAGYSEAEIHGLREEGGIGSVRAWGLTVERVGNRRCRLRSSRTERRGAILDGAKGTGTARAT
jgi:hypothetical protein